MCCMSYFWKLYVMPLECGVRIDYAPITRVMWRTRPWTGCEEYYGPLLASRACLNLRTWAAAGLN